MLYHLACVSCRYGSVRDVRYRDVGSKDHQSRGSEAGCVFELYRFRDGGEDPAVGIECLDKILDRLVVGLEQFFVVVQSHLEFQQSTV